MQGLSALSIIDHALQHLNPKKLINSSGAIGNELIMEIDFEAKHLINELII